MPQVRHALNIPEADLSAEARIAQRRLRVQLLTNEQVVATIMNDFRNIQNRYNGYRNASELTPPQIRNLTRFVTEVTSFRRTLERTLQNTQFQSIRVYNRWVRDAHPSGPSIMTYTDPGSERDPNRR